MLQTCGQYLYSLTMSSAGVPSIMGLADLSDDVPSICLTEQVGKVNL